MTGAITRRSLLSGGLIAAAGAVLTSCSGSDSGRAARTSTPVPNRTVARRSTPDVTASAGDRPRILLAYFSRRGENYYYGGRRTLRVGNTEVLAGTISKLVACDIHRIVPADPYSDDYDETVARNVREQQADARPALSERLPDVAPYDVVLLGSPIWNVRAPMIMTTFTEALEFTGKTVHPVVTYAVSGLGTTVSDYTRNCPGARVGEGLAVLGETVTTAQPQVSTWLTRVGLRP